MADPVADQDTVEDALERDARSALAQHQFELMFQPIYDLDEVGLFGLEALLRWNHPQLGLLQPEEFIPRLESSGVIVEVGRWVLAESCRHMARWRKDGRALIVSVNVSPRQLDSDAFVDDVFEALDSSGIEPSALTIEVPEKALTRNVEVTARRLRAVKELGVQVAIDDFGTGCSRLVHLRQFPIDCLKIDRSFIDALSRSPQSDALISTLVQLGRDLGLRTLAEGVENAAQIARLREENVDAVQGFLFARPMTIAAIDEELERSAAQRVAVPAGEA